MQEMGATMFGSGLMVQMGIDVLKEGLLAFEAHHEHIVLINLTIQLFFASSGSIADQTVHTRVTKIAYLIGDGPVKHGPDAYSHLILQRTFAKHTPTSMATQPAHDIDRAPYQDYKKDIVYVPEK